VAKDVIMPVLGMNQDTAVLLSWLKQEGEQVREGEPIMEVETDKATMELDAPATGTLANVSARAGEEVRVGSVIAVILADGEAAAGAGAVRESAPAAGGDVGAAQRPGSDGRAGAAPAAGAGAPATERAEGLATTSGTAATATAAAGPVVDGGRVPASPKARRLAKEHSVDLQALRGIGSGPEGAVLAADVVRAAERRPQAIPAVSTATQAASTPWTAFQTEIDAAPLLQALAQAREAHTASDRASSADIGDLIARFLGAVWTRHPLAGDGQERAGGARLRYRRIADGRLQDILIEDAGRTGVLAIAAARTAAGGDGEANGATPEMTLLDLTRARADLSGDAAASPGAVVSVVAGRLDERVITLQGAPELRATLTLHLAFDAARVELAAAAMWSDRIIELVEDPAALALLY
jgi:pyruvate dehydrogenase E2 component (dihydrolipoamide acetyltransferase)